jgi:hypothetical protein
MMPPVSPATEEVKRILPKRRARIPGRTRRASRYGARRLTARVSSKVAASTSS